MPPREWKFRIDDMIESIELIQKYIKGLDLLEFSSDQKTIDATIRKFEILGEAANHVPAAIQKKYSKIPWAKIKGMRNILAHEYFGVNHEILWKTSTDDIPKLLPILRIILKKE